MMSNQIFAMNMMRPKVKPATTGAFYRSWGTAPMWYTGNTTAMFYGRVNKWANNSALLEQEIIALNNHGVDGYMIEMAGFASPDMWTSNWLSNIETQYNTLVSLCRDYKKWLFVSIVNDNLGSGKYDDPGIPLGDPRIWPYAIDLCGIVKAAGIANVIVQPVAETGSSAGYTFEEHCLHELSPRGFYMINNSGSRPGEVPKGYQAIANHPEHIENIPASPPRKTLVVSDHSVIIKELAHGELEGPGDVPEVKRWATLIKNANFLACCYYAFKYEDFDEPTIQALGEVKNS